MKIAIVGGGFAGLTAAYELTKRGHTVTLLEKDTVLGGLAHGWRENHWQWHLEKAYHHLFTNDRSIIRLIKTLGLKDKIIKKRPVTANYIPQRDKGWDATMYQFDSPMHLLGFPGLSLVDKIRTGMLLGFLKINPFWRPLEAITAETLFRRIGGEAAWNMIWKPLMVGKFSDFSASVAASWLWARIKKRTPQLLYISGGFHTIVTALSDAIKKQGGTIHLGTSVTSIKKHGAHLLVTWNGQTHEFDRVLLTVPTSLIPRLVPELPQSYLKQLAKIPHLHAQTLILETHEPILKKTYWLNVTDTSFPFLAVVAHTNFIDKRHYGGYHLTYIGNYLPDNHPYLSMTKHELLKTFLPYLRRLSRNSKFDIRNSYLFTGPFAQPVHERHYSRIAPTLTTPIQGLYVANLDSIYPWDRGTNYAVELGERAAKTILKEMS